MNDAEVERNWVFGEEPFLNSLLIKSFVIELGKGINPIEI